MNPWEDKNYRLSLIAAELVGFTKSLIDLGVYPANHVAAAEEVLRRWDIATGQKPRGDREH